jgi:hypothetical protein
MVPPDATYFIIYSSILRGMSNFLAGSRRFGE